MKFPHLPMGQRFSFKGKTYTKTGPLTASEEETGKSRLIMNSAEVMPLNLVEKPVAQKDRQFSESEMKELFADYRKELRNALRDRADQDGSLSLNEVLDLIGEQSLPIEIDYRLD